ncbi:MAG: cell division protein FtsW [Ruminococcus sp.]|uniref:FtsW/RodA/SpoVE family cell cycle protein n=1 Tax=Roseburia sp. MSJ-14 TaxID=2841514 RepID=UPI001C0FF953|nr:putative peptidoglycan glycosyltransferase FtsW [Roseburia sp. MSJ-14]MBQ1475078.1 cell division protein FtsW [Ruminococcus sp.]MBQ1898998.1 cell division protein FtsW [Ruminococcus sp.]MBQ4238494.1 cell division protein FtsW [Ruminococcus sp.]MBU5474236.1 putative lipid II flippase FtsW [Roseburia sp. MSJ-14]
MLTIENTSRRRVRDYESERRASSKKGRRKINFSLLNIGKGIDIPFVLLIFVLLAIGITMMFSASYPVAYYEIGDSYYYLKRQLIFALIGLVVMIAVSFVDYHYYHRFAAIILGISYFALVLVLVLPSQEGGVHRWIGVGMFGIQASEISKFAIILFMAHWGSRYYDRMDTLKYGVLPGAAVFLSTAFLLLFEPHYSCIVIIGILTVVMMYVSGIKIKWLAIGAAVLAVLILLLWVTGMLTYAMERMDGWGQALSDDLDRDMWNSTWQTRNSLYAIGSGGLFGLGLGQSRQKYLYLPEPQNDFIFAIVCEELGLVGAVLILLIFALLVWRGIIISLRARDRFGKLLGIGLTTHIGLQVVLNILVITDWLPNTGISLPFFSYGGSSLLTLMFEMGVILAVSRTSNIEKS